MGGGRWEGKVEAEVCGRGGAGRHWDEEKWGFGIKGAGPSERVVWVHDENVPRVAVHPAFPQFFGSLLT